jgi:hypothetical protein
MHNPSNTNNLEEGAALARPLAQAIIWGGGSALSSNIADKKKDETPEERKARRKRTLKAGLIGALAGGGAYGIDKYLSSKKDA